MGPHPQQAGTSRMGHSHGGDAVLGIGHGVQVTYGREEKPTNLF